MLDHLILMMSLLASGHVGTGTIFGSSTWDKTNPHSKLACYRREIDDTKDLVIAHNTLPCGSRVWLYNPRTNMSVEAVVGDRGPRHAYADLSRQVAQRLGHNGREPILLVPLPAGALGRAERSVVEGDPDDAEVAPRDADVSVPLAAALQSGDEEDDEPVAE